MLAARILNAFCNEQRDVAERIVESLSRRASQLLEGFEKVALDFKIDTKFRWDERYIQGINGAGKLASKLEVVKEGLGAHTNLPGKERKGAHTECSVARTSRRFRGNKWR